MQDRFKFRIWDRDNKCFDYINLTGDLTEEIFIFNSIRNYFSNKYLTEHPEYIQQCTGLKDKNDKLIYEGDIVSYYSPYFMMFFTAKVIFDKERACFTMRGNEASYMVSITAPNIKEKEVMGNIYESPELLEEEDE